MHFNNYIRHNVHFSFRCGAEDKLSEYQNNIFNEVQQTIVFDKQALKHFLNMQLLGI